MPIYVYECEKCGTVDERIVLHATGKADVDCKECGGTMRRAITGHAKTPTKWTV